MHITMIRLQVKPERLDDFISWREKATNLLLDREAVACNGVFLSGD